MEHIVSIQQAGQTVRQIALGTLKLSRGALSRLKFSGGIRLNGQQARSTQRVSAGDVLCFVLTEPDVPQPSPSPHPLIAVWEDEHLLIADKPAPLATLPSRHQQGETLVNRVYSHLGCPEHFVYRPVNRLDKGTSGLLCIAKDAHIHQLLQRQLHTGLCEREYLAVCQGAPPEEQGVIDLPLGKGEGILRRVDPQGRKAVTLYQVLRRKGSYSLLKLSLLTGRTHQIRAHVSAIGCPIVGDYLYGTPHPALPSRFALHAFHLRLRHPISGQDLCFESPLPKELLDLLKHPQPQTNI